MMMRCKTISGKRGGNWFDGWFPDVPVRTVVEAQPTDDPTQVRLVVRARDEEFKPLDNANVRLTIHPMVATNSSSLELTADPSADNRGGMKPRTSHARRGRMAWTWLCRSSDGQMEGRAAAGWTSDPAVEEFRTLKPNRALLEALAKRTGGEVVAMDDLKNFVRRLPERGAPIPETHAEPLWRQPVIFLFVLACFLADWGLRRWKGLP